MARTIHRLSARVVATASTPGLMADGGGLYLQVSRQGTKSWIYRFTMNGKTRDMGVGPLHTVSLSEARAKAAECRKLARDGIDPIARRIALRQAKNAANAKALTFEQCAAAYIDVHKAGWTNAKHVQQWGNTLKKYAFPVFGNLPVDAVDTGLVLKVLEPIWKTKTETANRVRGRVENILDWATVRNYRHGENPARWRGHLDKTLPKRSKVQKPKHFPALPYEKIGSFMTALRQQTGTGSRALEMIILTATRTSETIGAKWDEFDLKKGVWNIPGVRMKNGEEHIIPLSSAALAVLNDLPRIDGSEFVFPGMRRGRPIYDMTCLNLVKNMGYEDITVHGFRSSFRDWAAEQTAFPREVAERALAHTNRDKVEAAYQRTTLFDKRRKLMKAWADYCAIDTSQRDNVTPIRKDNL
jgi:integrase